MSSVSNENIVKGRLPELTDPNHTYVFRSGEHGIYDYWYMDHAGNYWKYSNAPEGHKEYDPLSGIPLLVEEQPTPSKSPGFFTPEGKKRHTSVPEGTDTIRNENYNPVDPENLWYEYYVREEGVRYVYLDADVRENLDLWVQYQVRVADVAVSRLRRFASDAFQSEHMRDRVIGAILMLVDQGLFTPEELVNATVRDLSFVDRTVRLLGRKFICDDNLFDFITSLLAQEDPDAPLFSLETYHGKSPVRLRHLYAIFRYLRVFPSFLRAWNASHKFSQIVNRLSVYSVPPDLVEDKAVGELRRIFASKDDPYHLVDASTRRVLLDNYKLVVKSLSNTKEDSDYFATLIVDSSLTKKTTDEMEYSSWLHSTPMHYPVGELPAPPKEKTDV